jgi:hypothetical protein
MSTDRKSKGFGGVRQAAESFRVSAAEVRRRAQSGEWPSWVIGGKRVFDLDEIATIEARQREASIEQAVRAEREACAVAVINWANAFHDFAPKYDTEHAYAAVIAAAGVIRSRTTA